MNKFKIFIICILFNIFYTYAQTNNKLIAQRVFDNITNSIGNNFPSPPKLNFVTTESKVAYITNGNVYLEMKALDILCEQNNKEDAIAYVLSHELAHHYLNHSWMKNIGFTYTSKIKNELSNGTEAVNLRKSEEIQADLFGGFFSQISGYKSLIIGQEVLKSLYKRYNLPENIIGYPSLTDRENIVLNNLEELSKLSAIFNMGNLMVVTGEYSNAIKCFEHILSKNFTSREIYNNLGALYLEKAISFDDALSKFSYPILYEENTRSSNKEITRGFDGLSEEKTRDTIMYYLNLADDNFNRSVHLDNKFNKPKVNLLISEIIKSKIEKKIYDNDIIAKIQDLKLNISDENDIKLICLYLGLNKEIDEKECLKKISLISDFNFKVFHNTKFENEIQISEIRNDYTKLISDIEFTGLNKIDLNISSGNGIRIKLNKTETYSIYEYNNSKYFLFVSKNQLNDSDLLYSNNRETIIKKYGVPSSIYKINNLLYLNYKNYKIVIVLTENQVTEIIYYN